MHKTFFHLNAWLLPVVAWLGLSSLTFTLHAQEPSLTIEAVLRAVQQRKLILEARKVLQVELAEDARVKNGDPAPTNPPAPYEYQLIKWPDNVGAFPLDGSIHSMRTALAALNLAVAEYCQMESEYLTVKPAEGGAVDVLRKEGFSQTYFDSWRQEKGLPAMARFTEANWRENLRLFASCIDQRGALFWPMMQSYSSGGIYWENAELTDPDNPNSGYTRVSPRAGLFDTPASIASSNANVGSNVSGCWKGRRAIVQMGMTCPALAWEVRGGGSLVEYSSFSTQLFDAQSDLEFISGLKTKAVPARWVTGEDNIPTRNEIGGKLEFYRDAGPGPYGSAVYSGNYYYETPHTLNDGLSVTQPNDWSFNRAIKIETLANSSTGDFVLGDLGSATDADLATEYQKSVAWMHLPSIDASGCIWEEVSVSSYEDAWLETVTTTERRLKMPFGVGKDFYLDSNYYLRECASMNLWCLHRPNFPRLLPEVAKNIGGVPMDAGVVSLLPRVNEAVHIGLGRGLNDRQQNACLATPLDGLGSMDFMGAESGFELLYEDNPLAYPDAPLPLASGGGNPRSYHYLTEDEFTGDTIDTCESYPYGFFRSTYLGRWLHSRLRQVKGGDALVDITYSSGGYKKEMKFYWVSQLGAKDGNFYSIPGAAVPFKTITILNPSQSGATTPAENHETLKITENGTLQHLIELQTPAGSGVKIKNWTFTTTNVGAGAPYERVRTLNTTLTYQSGVSHWDDTVVEGGVTWHTVQDYEWGYDPSYTDFPILTSSTTTQGGDTKRTTVQWNHDVPQAYSGKKPSRAGALDWPWAVNLFWKPTQVTTDDGGDQLNPVTIEYDSVHYAEPKKETRKVMDQQHTVDHVWEEGGDGSSKHTLTSKLGGTSYAVSSLEYSIDLKKVTATTDGLVSESTYGAPDSTMPWVLIQSKGPDGWQQDFTHTFAAASTTSLVLSGMGVNHTGGASSMILVNRMGGLVSELTTSMLGGLTLSSTSGSDFTLWGQPAKLTYLDGRTESAIFNTNSTANYGTLSTATDIFGQQTSVSGYDALNRPALVDTGVETFTPDYTNPLQSKVTSNAQYEQSVQVNGFGEVVKSGTTQGSGASMDLTGNSPFLKAGERTVPLKLTDAKEVQKIGNGLGSRGGKTAISVEGGKLRVTSTELDQSGGDHQAVKTYYDANGRLVKRVSPGLNDAEMTETWTYPDARTVVYTPGPGPVLKAVTRTLSADGLMLTTSVGGWDASRQTRSVANGKLLLTTELKDDSDPDIAGGWTVVSTQTLDPASGDSGSLPWNLTAEAVTQSATGSTTRTVTGKAGTDTSSATLDQGMLTKLSGTSDGIGFKFENITRDHGRLTGASGTVAGNSSGFELDDDGRIKRLFGPGFDKHYAYGGAPGYEVTVTDSVQNTSNTLSSSAVGDFTGVSGDGVQPVSASTTEQAGGKTTTTISNFGVSIQNAADGSVLSKNYDGGLTESRSYDAEGLLTVMGTGPEAVTKTYGEDGLSSTTSGSGSTVTETFFNVGLRSGVSGGGETRSFTYKRLKKATETHEDGPWSSAGTGTNADTTLSYGQDDHGRLGSLTISDQYDVSYRYFGGTSRLSGIVPSVGSGADYGWDADSGQRTTMSRGAVTTTWGHDDIGRETSSTTTGGFHFESQFNTKHRRTSRTTSTGSSWTGMTYDAAGRLKGATLGDGTEMVYQYDDRGNRLAGGSVAVTYTVNALNQVTARGTVPGYGVYGKVTPGASVRVFHPLAADPVAGEELTVNAQGVYQGWWNLSSTGSTSGVTRVEILVRGTLPNAGSVIDGGPARKDAVSEKTVWAAVPTTSESFTYNAAGRLSEDATWTYAWDTGGHLTGLTRKANTAADPQVVAETISYRYDSDGRRTGRTHRLTKGLGDAQTVTTKESTVLWDGWLPVCETRTVNAGTGAGAVALPKRWFIWGPDVSGSLGGAGGIGGLVSIQEDGGRTLLPVDDGLGNIMALVDKSSGTTVATYSYGPYGEFLGSTGEADACPFGYQSKWWDAEASLSYFGYRHYSPRLGRWLSRDPLGEAGGMNLYAYCEGDPVNKYDFLGMDARTAKTAVQEAEKLLGEITLQMAQGGEMASKGCEDLADIYFQAAATSYDAYQSKLTLAQTEINSWRSEALFASTGPMDLQARLDALPITPAPRMGSMMADRFFQQSSSGAELTSELWDIQSETLTERAGRAQTIQLTADVAGLVLGLGNGGYVALKEGGRRALIRYLVTSGAVAGGSFYAFSKGREFAVANGATEKQLLFLDTGMRLFSLWALARPVKVPGKSPADPTLKSIRRYSERLVRGDVTSSNPATMAIVRSIRRSIANGRYNNAGTKFHSLNFRFVRDLQGRGFLSNLLIDRSIPTTGGFRPTRRPDYRFGNDTFDLKPWRPSRGAYDSTEQFLDIQSATGNLPIPFYYKLW